MFGGFTVQWMTSPWATAITVQESIEPARISLSTGTGHVSINELFQAIWQDGMQEQPLQGTEDTCFPDGEK